MAQSGTRVTKITNCFLTAGSLRPPLHELRLHLERPLLASAVSAAIPFRRCGYADALRHSAGPEALPWDLTSASFAEYCTLFASSHITWVELHIERNLPSRTRIIPLGIVTAMLLLIIFPVRTVGSHAGALLMPASVTRFIAWNHPDRLGVIFPASPSAIVPTTDRRLGVYPRCGQQCSQAASRARVDNMTSSSPFEASLGRCAHDVKPFAARRRVRVTRRGHMNRPYFLLSCRLIVGVIDEGRLFQHHLQQQPRSATFATGADAPAHSTTSCP